MPTELSKAYEPKQYEDEIYKHWEESGLFAPENLKNAKGKYVNILPPPNANGEMHVGHASGYTIMDLLGRYHRMKGEKTLLLPGKDHAGIQTQVVYEKKIKKERGITRHDLGREAFFKEVYDFCLDRAAYMRSQEKKIGLSADWGRETFTMDARVINVVLETFIKMFNETDNTGHKMIYRGERIINWCPRCATALSDVEVEHEERTTKLYTFKYSSDFPLSISTTRPETKLGDTAVAVNPKDKRYEKYIGKEFSMNFCGVPLVIKVIADSGVDSTFGTGALGVTPAHSAVDWEMAERNNLPIVKVINEQAIINPRFGKFSGMKVAEAREAVAQELRQLGLLEKEDEYINNLSVCERCKTPIEPLVSKQWFVDVDHKNFSLKKAAKQAIENDEIKIYPERFKSVMLDWVENVHDWCISRQIWWGPRIPVWYKDNNMQVQISSPGDGWKQDEDTFDTWFSSGQWAYSTLGYPDGNDYKEFYPSDTMIMGRDILPFWAFRMIILSLYRTGKVPFKNLYFTGLIRDEKGQKMSKSKGNGIDPVEMIQNYGTDAVRLSLLIGNTPGNDLNLGQEKIAGFRNFANKLWNIARFMLLTIDKPTADCLMPEPKTLADKWILASLNAVITATTENLDKFNLSYAGEQLRDFTWSELADWYLEIAKIEGSKSEMLNYILNTILKLWHPYMPFVTETIWQEMYGKDAVLMVEHWPAFAEATAGKPDNDFELVRKIIAGIRTLRSENKIEPVKKLKAVIIGGDKITLLREQSEIIKTLGRLEDLKIEKTIQNQAGFVGSVINGVEVYIDLGGVVDKDKEKERLAKELAEVSKYIPSLEAKLNNQDFVARAPAAVVEGEQKKLAEAKEKQMKLKQQLQSLS